jgi:integrase/recombinase XerD
LQHPRNIHSSMGTAHLYLNTRKCSDDKYMIYLYAPMDQGQPARISTGKKIEKDRWHPDGHLVGNSKEVKRENLILAGFISLANSIIRDYELRGRPLSREVFAREFRNPGSRDDFIAYMESEISGDFSQGHFGKEVWKMKLRTVRKLKEWREHIRFSDISREMLVSFDRWHAELQRKKGHDGRAARARALKHIKEFLDRAIEDKNLAMVNPFKGFKWPKYGVQREFLTEEEVFQFLDFYEDPELILARMKEEAARRNMNPWNAKKYASPSGVNRIRKVVQIFLFQCFTGLRYGDTQRLTKKHRHGKHLVFYPEKTASTSSKMVRMLITPIMDGLMNEASRNLMPRISNVKYNKYIKEAAQLAGIEKALSTHVARHTFATMFAARGGSVLALRDLLGLSKLETVLAYYHVTTRHLDDEMERVFGEIEKRKKPG